MARKALIPTLLLLFSCLTNAQEITNIRFEQEGKMINIYYDLSGKSTYDVKVYCSQDGGKTWGNPLTKIRGDVGGGQQVGTDKAIIWDVLAEMEKLQSEVNFKIEAKPEVAVVSNTLSNEDQNIFMAVESMPTFPGGEFAFNKYLAENINYPQEAEESGIQGRVFVTFVVEKNGELTDVRVLRGIGGGCDEEAIRVVKSMPNWNPGKQRGIPVRVQYNLPLKFTLP